MRISANHIAKYIALCKSELGIDVDESKAEEGLRQLVHAVELTYKPITKAEYEMVMQRRKDLGLPELKMEENENG